MNAAAADLVDDVDSRSLADPLYSEPELSARLARRGVLPMFGFPTRVRQLYRFPVRRRTGLERAAVSDRPLDMAITSFAPGAEVVRDGWAYRCVGFAAYEVRGDRALARDPLGPGIVLLRCRDCGVTQRADGDDPQACRVCGQVMAAMVVHQPLGFRTDYARRDYDDFNDDGMASAYTGARRNPR